MVDWIVTVNEKSVLQRKKAKKLPVCRGLFYKKRQILRILFCSFIAPKVAISLKKLQNKNRKIGGLYIYSAYAKVDNFLKRYKKNVCLWIKRRFFVDFLL